MIPLFRPHAGRHVLPQPSRRPARTGGHDLLTDAELAALTPRGLQPPEYAPFGEAEATGLWPSMGARIETALLADPEGSAS